MHHPTSTSFPFSSSSSFIPTSTSKKIYLTAKNPRTRGASSNGESLRTSSPAGDAERRLRVLLLYAIFEHAGDWPAIDVSEARLVFKLDPTTFNYMAVSDGIQRYMPGAADRDAPRAVPLAYKEAVLLVNPSEPQFVGGDKYQYYSMDNKENRVHGWIAGAGGGDGGDPRGGLWEDAKAQAEDSFPESPDFHKAGERGFVTGRQVVDVPAGLACVGLVTPGRRRARYVGLSARTYSSEIPRDISICLSTCHILLLQGYQFWMRASATGGTFAIGNVRAWEYNLYAWVPGVLGDYMRMAPVTVLPGGAVALGDLVFEPPRSGPERRQVPQQALRRQRQVQAVRAVGALRRAVLCRRPLLHHQR
ncbi:hypothetical protein ZWY2020_015893 [Hordeum vulgare]|nr:hypothetical protein ZWY2020_015893 [Hordeum vulgare]